MVASDNQCQHRRNLCPSVIPVVQMRRCEAQLPGERLWTYLLIEFAELAEFVWNRHTLQVLLVAYCLKVPAYQERVDFVVVSGLEICDMLVNCV